METTTETDQGDAPEGNGETSWDDVAQRSQDMQAHTIEEHVRDAERIVEVPLTEAEKAEKADEMARLDKDIASAEGELDRIKKEFKEKIGGLESSRREVSQEVWKGTSPKVLEISEGVDGTGHNMVTVRKDTGAVIDVRPLTPDERQGKFEWIEGGASEEEPDEDGGNVVTHPAAAKPSLEDLDGYTKAQLVDVADRWGIEVDPKLTKADVLDAVRKGLFPSFQPAGQGDGDDAS